MQRQAALIAALSTQPEYLLLDEIFDGLDPVMRQLLKKILSNDVAERGMTVMIASHNLRELEDLCDHVGLLHKGGVILERELDELKLGINKVQAVFKPMPEMNVFKDLDIVKSEIRGSLINLVIRGTKEEILTKINALSPIFVEVLPLTLEEVFISEMEVAGYDIENILR
jgi:ABC-2 type transport system ATP-binding protein